MAGAARYEVFQQRGFRKRWRYRLIASNNEQVGPSSEAYRDKTDAKRGAIDHQNTATDAEIIVVEPE